MTSGEDRVRRIVGGVIRAALRDTGSSGLVLVTPADPQGALLLRWIRSWEIEVAEPGEVESLAAGLAASGAEDTRAVDGELHRAAARILARRRNLLPVHPIHKTSLLLGGAPPPEPLLPLADLFASRLAWWCERVNCPVPLRDVDKDELAAVDRTLERYLDGRLSWTRAARALDPDLRRAVKDALDRGRWHRLWAPVAPKLGPRTPGIDLDL